MKKDQNNVAEKIMQWLTAQWIAHPLYTVVKLGIPDMLADGPQSVEELAQSTESHAPFLYRILKALASVGFFYEREHHMFHIAPMGEMLREGGMKPIVLMFLSEWHNSAWSRLFHSVKTGDIPFESAHGKACFDWLKDNPEAAREFNEANEIKAVSSHRAITEVYDFSDAHCLVDVGGGYGGLLYHVLHQYPALQGCIADLPYMAQDVEERIRAENLASRCRFAGCDFFSAIPGEADCYLLSNILHDWDDGKCGIILKNCHAAMPPEAKLLIMEAIIPENNEFSMATLLDLEVLVMGGGKERTAGEFRTLLDQSGFALHQTCRINDSIAVLECTKK